MRTARLSRNTRQWVISALLVALVTRALIPAGFMPATDRPFSFQICPDGFPAQLLTRSQNPHAHHQHAEGHAAGVEQIATAESDTAGTSTHHQHSAAGKEHCVFAAAAVVGPLAFAPTFAAEAVIALPVAALTLPSHTESIRFRIPQPRGPPNFS
jgi:hypothetical protein